MASFNLIGYKEPTGRYRKLSTGKPRERVKRTS
jgi:hypothetical protein